FSILRNNRAVLAQPAKRIRSKPGEGGTGSRIGTHPADEVERGAGLIDGADLHELRSAGRWDFCPYVFCAGRGHLATTTVEIPPRGRKSPFTSAHTGLAQRTTSSSTWFTTFSWKMPRFRYAWRYSFNDFSSRHS